MVVAKVIGPRVCVCVCVCVCMCVCGELMTQFGNRSSQRRRGRKGRREEGKTENK